MKHPMAAAVLAGSVIAAGLIGPVQAGHMSHAFAAQHGDAMMHSQQSDPAKLGIAIAPLSQDTLASMTLEYGVRVEQVIPESVAAGSGLQAGDVVTEVDGRPAYSPERLQYLVNASGDRSAIAIVRGTDRMELQISYAKADASRDDGKAVLGVRIQEMTSDLKEAFGTQDRQGVLISQVMKGSAAARAGLKAGDVLVAIGGEPVQSVGDVQGKLKGMAAGRSIAIGIVRDREPTTLNADLDAHPVVGAKHPIMGHGHGHGMMYKKHCKPGKSHDGRSYYHS